MGHRHFRKHSFDPATLHVLYAAFDSAWKVVEADTDATNRDAVRDAIALALIGLAQVGETDVERLTAYALARARHELTPPPRVA